MVQPTLQPGDWMTEGLWRKHKCVESPENLQDLQETFVDALIGDIFFFFFVI